MPDAFGVGEFRAAMAIYEDSSYLNAFNSPPTVDAEETLYIGEIPVAIWHSACRKRGL